MVKTKTRVGVLMRESLKGKTASSNAFPNLVTLSERYDTWCKQVRGLIVALQQHHAVMGQIEKTRANVRTTGTTTERTRCNSFTR
jgi:hypothetical protein